MLWLAFPPTYIIHYHYVYVHIFSVYIHSNTCIQFSANAIKILHFWRLGFGATPQGLYPIIATTYAKKIQCPLDFLQDIGKMLYPKGEAFFFYCTPFGTAREPNGLEKVKRLPLYFFYNESLFFIFHFIDIHFILVYPFYMKGDLICSDIR